MIPMGRAHGGSQNSAHRGSARTTGAARYELTEFEWKTIQPFAEQAARGASRRRSPGAEWHLLDFALWLAMG
jgi:hypothetical protein